MEVNGRTLWIDEKAKAGLTPGGRCRNYEPPGECAAGTVFSRDMPEDRASFSEDAKEMSRRYVKRAHRSSGGYTQDQLEGLADRIIEVTRRRSGW